MRLHNTQEVQDFKAAIEKCVGEVWLESQWGDRYNLKSILSQYVALGALLTEHGDELELFCQVEADERHFYKFFKQYPNVL